MNKEILDLAKALMRIPSTKDDAAAKRSVIARGEQQLDGFEIHSYDHDGSPSLLATNARGTAKNFRVILNAHLDVVPGQPAQFEPYEHDGKLIGRGAMDMKAAAAALIVVFKELADKVAYPVALQLVTDEEVGGFDGTKYQIDDGIRAEFVIAGEPTRLDINDKAKGIMWARITTKGVSAHGAYPWNGVNAIDKMARVLQKITLAYPTPKQETWRTTVNVAKIETSNDTFNKVPDDCTVSLDIRYIPEDREAMKKFLRTVARGDDLEIFIEEPAQFTDSNNYYVQALKTTVMQVTSRQPAFIQKHGGSDIRHFNQAGCPGVTFGPTGEGMHTDNEWVDIRSLEQYYDIVHDFLLALDKEAR